MKEDTTGANDQESNDRKDQINPMDILEISNLTIKKSTKRKLKQKMNLHDNADTPSSLNLQEVSNNDQAEEVVQIQSEFELQCDRTLPPDPSILARYLFEYWEEVLNFHEHMVDTESDTFAEETLNELSILVFKSSPYTTES